MTTIDFRPFYRTVRDFDRLASRLVPGIAPVEQGPAFDLVETGADQYEIAVAVPGWQRNELVIALENGVLTVKGEPVAETRTGRVLQRGIAKVAFERRFALADHIEVGDASLVDGILRVHLVRQVPEALKPRTIPIGNGSEALSAAA